MGLFGSSRDKETIERLTQQINQQKAEYERKISEKDSEMSELKARYSKREDSILAVKEIELQKLKDKIKEIQDEITGKVGYNFEPYDILRKEENESKIKILEDEIEILKEKLNGKKVGETVKSNPFVLCAGKYFGGKTIPIGIYNLKIISGTGIVETQKPYKVMKRLESNPETRKERNWSDSYNGLVVNYETILDISESAKVSFELFGEASLDDSLDEYIEKKEKIENEIKYLNMVADGLKSKVGDVIRLKKGVYYGGSSIPTGNYNLKILSGHTMVETSKPKVYFNLSKEYDGFDTEYFGLEIKEGTKLQINSTAEIEFCLMDKITSENGVKIKEEVQNLDKEIEKLIEIRDRKKRELEDIKGEIQKINNEVIISNRSDSGGIILSAGVYKAGDDIDVGKYDIRAVFGSGSVELSRGDVYVRMSATDENKVREYRNLDMKQGTRMTICDNLRILVEPSQKMQFSQNERPQIIEEIDTINEELKILNDDLIQKYYLFSDYDNITSEDCKNKLTLLKQEEKQLRELDKDVIVIRKEGGCWKLSQRTTRQILRSFNMECDNIMLNVGLKNIDQSRKKIQQSFETLNKLYSVDGVELTKKILELKLEQITLMYTYELKYQQEKDIQRAIKEQMLEEAKAQREIEEQKKKIEKDLQQHLGEINRIMKYMQKTQIDAEKQLYMDKIKELEERIKVLQSDKETVLEREANAKAGFVYIISNIGSFGENIYKIGMTRRLEPMDRIHELSSASVPFEFDVHAMIFSSDAPELETTLHRHFASNAVNKVNPRKEFYNVDIEEIERVIKENYNDMVQFTKIPIAAEYRQSLNLMENAPLIMEYTDQLKERFF